MRKLFLTVFTIALCINGALAVEPFLGFDCTDIPAMKAQIAKAGDKKAIAFFHPVFYETMITAIESPQKVDTYVKLKAEMLKSMEKYMPAGGDFVIVRYCLGKKVYLKECYEDFKTSDIVDLRAIYWDAALCKKLEIDNDTRLTRLCYLATRKVSKNPVQVKTSVARILSIQSTVKDDVAVPALLGLFRFIYPLSVGDSATAKEYGNLASQVASALRSHNYDVNKQQ